LDANDNRLHVNANNFDNNDNWYSFEIALVDQDINMKTYNKLYEKIISFDNLLLAWKKARKGKTKKDYVIEFEKNLEWNLLDLEDELKREIYKPKPLINFILRDPKTRKISKSDFRDRIVHHAIFNILEPIFDRTFIYDSCANRKGKGVLFAIKRFDIFKRKVTKNFTSPAFCLKADIKHYFEEVNHEILIGILSRKINDRKVLELINEINANFGTQRERERELTFWFSGDKKGMPLGNLTSQFFANIYLNKLDYFVKHILKAKYYLRYVDDFVILHESKEQLEEWKTEIVEFLREKLKLELHPQKSRIVLLSKGIDFVGFRNFHHHKLLRKRNIRNIRRKNDFYRDRIISFSSIKDSYRGWQAYAKWGNTYKLREQIKKEIIDNLCNEI